jgi:hypothetical protein
VHLKGLSHEIDVKHFVKNLQKLRNAAGYFFLRGSDEFIMQKVYLLWLMPVCIGIIMLAAYFCHSCCSQEEYNCSLITMDWLDACTALKVVDSPSQRVSF